MQKYALSAYFIHHHLDTNRLVEQRTVSIVVKSGKLRCLWNKGPFRPEVLNTRHVFEFEFKSQSRTEAALLQQPITVLPRKPARPARPARQ